MALRAFRSNPSLGGFGGESFVPSAPLIASDNNVVAEKHGDAFGQIIKELVDNAMDACTANSDTDEAKRVRVLIREPEDDNESNSYNDEDLETPEQVLRVTVVDNGCGMENVEECVDAFHSSKAQSPSRSGDKAQISSQKQTSGRYGVGLTLSLLHAQRLVPNSYASITSATSTASKFTRASYVVDVDGDSIRCDKIELIPKKSPKESGTAVSVLVPGGQTALYAWPRLAEYFARFQLIRGLNCSLEVLAPSLSTVPLFVRPTAKQPRRDEAVQSEDEANKRLEPESLESQSVNQDVQEDDAFWNDGMVLVEETNTNESPVILDSISQDGEEVNDDRNVLMTTSTTNKNDSGGNGGIKSTKFSKCDSDTNRRELLAAASSSYLQCPVLPKNVAHSMQPIRSESGYKGVGTRPMLELDMVVYDSSDESTIVSEEQDQALAEEKDNPDVAKKSANLMLVRIVNRVPLLDSAEASACGLVQGLCWKQSVWNSFGLHIAPADEKTEGSTENKRKSPTDGVKTTAPSILKHLCVPTYVVRDSDQVAPFFEMSTHTELDTGDTDEDSFHEDEELEEKECFGQKRKRSGHRVFLPANVRIGNILVIARIHASPSSLPLPTLSKGRLPMNERSINDALELGILSCLRSLQVTNPSLLLTAQQLKETERDSRFIPAVAAAIASISSKSQNESFRRSIAHSVKGWDATSTATNQNHDLPTSATESVARHNGYVQLDNLHIEVNSDCETTLPVVPNSVLNVTTLGPLIEKRLRWISSARRRKKTLQRQNKEEKNSGEPLKERENDEYVGIDDFLSADEPPEADARSETEPGGRILEKWEDPFSDDDSW